MKKLISIIILTCFTLTTSLYAASPLKKGEAAPHEGILLTIAEDTAIKKDLINLDVYKVTYPYQKEKADMFKKAYEETIKENEKLRKQKEWVKYIYFGCGILITSLAVKGAGELK